MYGGHSATPSIAEQNRNSGTTTPATGGTGASSSTEKQEDGVIAPAPGVTEPKRELSASRFGRGGGAAIPAWQMDAKNKSIDGGTNTSEIGSGA